MKNQFKILGYSLLFSFVVTTWIFWYYEQGTNPNVSSFGDAAWWWVVTSTTVGYGDISPITLQGRLAGVLSIIIGVYFYTNLVVLIHNYVRDHADRHRLGTAQVTSKDHVIICEYTAFADELLQVIDRYPELAKRDIVVVTDLVGINPYPQFKFVRGVPLSPSALAQANIEHAAYIFVFSNTRFREPDLKTLHAVSRIQKLNSRAAMFVELHEEKSEYIQHLAPSFSYPKNSGFAPFGPPARRIRFVSLFFGNRPAEPGSGSGPA